MNVQKRTKWECDFWGGASITPKPHKPAPQVERVNNSQGKTFAEVAQAEMKRHNKTRQYSTSVGGSVDNTNRGNIKIARQRQRSILKAVKAIPMNGASFYASKCAGIGDDAARRTLDRLIGHGSVKRKKNGNTWVYWLTAKGRDELEVCGAGE